MSLSVPDDVMQQVDDLEGRVSTIQQLLEPLLDVDKQALESQCTPLQRAERLLLIAESANVLFHLYLRTLGVDTEKHAVTKETERLRLYATKLKKVAAEKELSESSRSLAVDVAAANRFINSAIPDLTPSQRADLKKVTEKRKQKKLELDQTQDQGADEPTNSKRHESNVQGVGMGRPIEGNVEAFLEDVLKQAKAARPAGNKRRKSR